MTLPALEQIMNEAKNYESIQQDHHGEIYYTVNPLLPLILRMKAAVELLVEQRNFLLGDFEGSEFLQERYKKKIAEGDAAVNAILLGEGRGT